MRAGLIGNIKEKVAGWHVDHHTSDCQVGGKGGLRISKKPRWRHKGTWGVVTAVWFWLLRVRAVIRLRNFVVLIKKEDVQHGAGTELRTQYFDVGNLLLVPPTPSDRKGSLWHWTDRGKKTYLCFTSLQPENISKVEEQACSTLPKKKDFTKIAVELNTC